MSKNTQHSTINHKTFLFLYPKRNNKHLLFFRFLLFLVFANSFGILSRFDLYFFHPGWSMVGPAIIHSPCNSSIFFFFIFVIPVLSNIILLVIRLFFWASRIYTASIDSRFFALGTIESEMLQLLEHRPDNQPKIPTCFPFF